MYEELIKSLRACAENNTARVCPSCPWALHQKGCVTAMVTEAADAIEELLKAASAMHTWIFLNSGDEQAAYDECGLSDKMNAALGYGGQFAVEMPKEGE